MHRPKVTSKTSDAELFDIFCQMLEPLNDGHVELKTKAGDKGETRYFTAEKKPRFYQEFTYVSLAGERNARPRRPLAAT
jgi:hypothetical protein